MEIPEKSRISRFGALLILAVTLVAVRMLTPAGAEDAAKPKSVGTSADGAATVGNAPAQRLQPVDQQSVDKQSGDTALVAERTASHLLDIARGEADTGRADVAQRILEQLIARFPDTASAAPARRQLFAIYGRDAQIASQSFPAPAAPALPLQQPQSQRVAAPALTPQPTPIAAGTQAMFASPGGGWRTSIMSFRLLQDSLRNEIGDRVFFGAGSEEIVDRARSVLAQQASWLVQRPDLEVVVEGHADDADAGADNAQIAWRRAEAVRWQLISSGVEPARLSIAHFGAAEPVALCDDPGCQAQNRRVVVRITGRARPGALAVETSGEASGGSVGGEARR